MGRATVYNAGLVTDEKWEKVLKENKNLLTDFIGYCKAQDRSPQTILQYTAQLKIVFCYIMEKLDNKFFCDIKKREWVTFIAYLVDDLRLSPNRVHSIKSAISSFSNYIENILDDEYDYHNMIKSIPAPAVATVREKSVLSAEQMQEVLDTLVADKKYELACFVALLISSGCRKAEAIQMKVSFFTDDKLVLKGLFWKTPSIRCKGHGKIGKMLNKFVKVNDFTPYLNLWMEDRRERGIESEWLFPVVQPDGSCAKPAITNANTWSDAVSRITEKKFGMCFYCHACRHYFVTSMARDKYPDSIITQIVGWAKGSNLVGVYNDQSAEEEMSEFFDSFTDDDDEEED